jgi:quercetin dioxygenase-like cupin family protein
MNNEWLPVGTGGQRRVIADGEKIMLVQVKFVEGGMVPEHKHVHEQITYVIKGRMRFTLPDKTVEIGEGENILLPSNLPHTALALEESLLIDTFSPPREDFR